MVQVYLTERAWQKLNKPTNVHVAQLDRAHAS